MLEIIINLIPLGDRSLTKTLYKGKIVNQGTGTLKKGNYFIKLFKAKSNKRVWKTGKVKDFPRKRLNAWHLLYQALKEIFDERQKS